MNRLIESTRLLAILLCSALLASACGGGEEEEPSEELPPIALACDHFSEDRVLENDPQRPVDYTVGCFANVQGALQIEPGVVIAFENHAGLRVNLGDKLFEIRGTAAEPVVLTGTAQQQGHWRGLFFAEAHNTSNLIEHTTIEYAGSQPLTESSPIYEGSLALRGVSGTPPQALTLRHVEISSGGSVGLDFTRIQPNATVVTSNLVITGNAGVPVKVTAAMAHVFDATSSFVGNERDFVNVVEAHYEIEDSRVWHSLDAPFLVDGRVHIKDGGHLTIEAGSQLYFEPQAYLQPYDGSTAGGNELSLKVLGTAASPVLLAAANGTNWGGILMGFTQEDNVISHAIIENAKGDFLVGNHTDTGAIYMHAGPVLSVDNTVFRNIPNCAFYGAGSDPFARLTTAEVTFESVGQELCEP